MTTHKKRMMTYLDSRCDAYRQAVQTLSYLTVTDVDDVL